VLSISTKAQAWYLDFAISMLLFTVAVVIYFSYANNVQKQEKGDLDSLISDAKFISSSLAISGYPSDWDSTSVIRIGISDGQKVNETKYKNFKNLNYSRTKAKFATYADYFVYFVNSNGDVLNINGVCGVGQSAINTTYNIRSAYYYQDEDDSFLKNFMVGTFNADVFNDDISALGNNLSKYSFVVMEHPLLSGGEFSNYKATLENFTSRGGLLMLSGELASPATNALAGADFKKKSGQSSSQRTAIVNNTDQYLAFTPGQSMIFNQYYYVQNTAAENFLTIATFNNTDDRGVAKWNYGNGTVYFLSDFEVTGYPGNFLSLVQSAATGLVQGTCNPINISAISTKKLARIERYLSHNSKLVKMVVYVWE